MPATYTHAVYGRQVLDQLEPALRERIISHLDCYNIGLHGPDLLFFYKPLSQAPIKKQGYAMHHEPGRPFFEHARTLIRQSVDPEAALAYILGFINHFVLDSLNHPAIFAFQEESGLEPQRDRVGMGSGADGRAGQGSAAHPLDGASDDFARVLPGDRAVL